MEDRDFVKKICVELNLGAPKGVKSVSGGYMHKMYRLKTDSGVYAVKILNSEIMKRPDVFDNYAIAEVLEQKLSDHNIPIVPALKLNNQKMQCVDGRHFYVFDWVKGKSLKEHKIKKEHCALMGTILAKIHKIEIRTDATIKDDILIDWDNYISKAKKTCPEIEPLLSKNRAILYNCLQKGNEAMKNLPRISCISNGDMDGKNVLWHKGRPLLIDLESLNYGNPYTELFQLALCWSGYESCRINFDLLDSFISAYITEFGRFDADWTDLYFSNVGRLEWLEYNIKRALMIECADENERKLGIEQVKETMAHIVYYEEINDRLITHLEKVFVN
ncbi:MAG: phosphotransferase [Eubacterium sp.]|nr:phosphotransferase [Eubacterium sp.]